MYGQMFISPFTIIGVAATAMFWVMTILACDTHPSALVTETVYVPGDVIDLDAPLPSSLSHR